MTSNRMTKKASVLVALVSALGGASLAGVLVYDAPSSTPAPPSSPRESIGVEGAWEIDVVNRDGSVAETRKFHNGLEAGAADVLARLTSPPNQTNIDGFEIALTRSAGGNIAQVATTTLNGAGGSVSVADFAPFAESDTVTEVRTELVVCTPNALGGCEESATPGLNRKRYTRTTLATPLSVAADQALRVRVTITFATAP